MTLQKYMRQGSILTVLLFCCTTVWAQPAKDTTAADCLISVAYSNTRQSGITYSVSSVRYDDIKNNSVFSSGNALYGKLPGLTVIQQSSIPGSDAPQFLLRGRSTTVTNSPLILVDGIERDMNDIPLEDIDQVVVLKDAAATVLYGIRAANGVVLVTTKRGEPGRLKINANVEQILSSPTRTPSFISAAAFVEKYNQALTGDELPRKYTAEQIAGYNFGDRYYYPDVDWQKELTRNTAWGTRANVNASGGDSIASYYASLSYYKNSGIYKNTTIHPEGYSTNLDLNNISFRSNLDVHINPDWLVSLQLGGRIYNQNAPGAAIATIWDNMYRYPQHIFPVYVADDLYGGTNIYQDNPVGLLRSRGYKNGNFRTIFSKLSTEYDLSRVFKGLSAGLLYATDNFYKNQEGYSQEFLVREVLGSDENGAPVLSDPIGKDTNLTPYGPNGDEQNKRNSFEANMKYRASLSDTHALSALLMYHQDKCFTGNETPYIWQFVSGRLNYAYAEKYLLELGASYSGREAFPACHRFGFFPAVSAAWVLTRENFLKQSAAIDFLKFRLSAGTVGNASAGGRFLDRAQYTTDDGYVFGNANTAQSGLFEGALPNIGYTWETAHKYDIGVDATLFKTFNLSVTGFFEERTGIMAPESDLLPAIFGGKLPAVNAGVSQNKGIEARLSLAEKKQGWGYSIGVNAGCFHNKLIRYPEPAQPEAYLYRAGRPVNQPFLLEAIGFFNSVDEINNSPLQTFGPVKPGDLKYKDQNGDDKIDDFDKIPMNKTSIPAWDLGFDLTLQYHNFEISAFFQGQFGRSIYLGDTPSLFWPLYNNGSRISTYARNSWTEQTKNSATYPRLSTSENQNNYRPSSFWYINGDFVRLRSLNLSYKLPGHFLSRILKNDSRVFLRGMNLFTLDHLKFADPEVQSGYPVMKSCVVGVSFNF